MSIVAYLYTCNQTANIRTVATCGPAAFPATSAPEALLVSDADAISYLNNLFSQSKGIALGLLGWASLCATILKLMDRVVASEKFKTLSELSVHNKK